MKSRIDASVDYAETKQAYGDDEGSESVVYDIKGPEGNDIEVAVGHEHLPVNGSKKVVFFPLPKTSTGKIQKFELRKKAKELN